MNIKVVLSLCCLITVFSCEKRASTDSVNAEANSRIEELAAEKGIEGEDLESLKAMVTSIARTQNHFSFEYLSEHCDEDFERLCSSSIGISRSLKCIKTKRELASESCQIALRNEFGGLPLEEAEVYNGVPIPKGSYYRYGRDGKISSVVTFEKIKYKDIDLSLIHI